MIFDEGGRKQARKWGRKEPATGVHGRGSTMFWLGKSLFNESAFEIWDGQSGSVGDGRLVGELKNCNSNSL